MEIKVLMVCLGNICRSPLAEGILRSKINSGNNIVIDSAGTGGWHAGELPDKRSIEVAKKHGIDLSGQRARKFTPGDLVNFDLIYVMDSQNLEDVLTHVNSKEQRHKVKLILDELDSNSPKDVPDPYYGGTQGFEYVFSLLDMACEVIAGKLQS